MPSHPGSHLVGPAKERGQLGSVPRWWISGDRASFADGGFARSAGFFGRSSSEHRLPQRHFQDREGVACRPGRQSAFCS
jgi:hypothetical protein